MADITLRDRASTSRSELWRLVCDDGRKPAIAVLHRRADQPSLHKNVHVFSEWRTYGYNQPFTTLRDVPYQYVMTGINSCVISDRGSTDMTNRSFAILIAAAPQPPLPFRRLFARRTLLNSRNAQRATRHAPGQDGPDLGNGGKPFTPSTLWRICGITRRDVARWMRRASRIQTERAAIGDCLVSLSAGSREAWHAARA